MPVPTLTSAIPYPVPTEAQYTTDLGDVLAYQYETRTLGGGTSIGSALIGSAADVDFNAITGRTNPKAIVLMTDASCVQIEPYSVDIADQLRAQGYYIVVMAIGPAASCPILSQVADPGALLLANDYATLENSAVSLAQDLVTDACNAPPYIPTPNLTVTITSFDSSDCSPGPGTYTVNYTVTNTGDADFNSALTTSFYDNSPTSPVANYLLKDEAGPQFLAGGGGTYNGSFSSASLAYATTLYGVVNLDGSQVGNEVPLTYNLADSQLVTIPEKKTSDNFSDGFNLVNGAGCAPQAKLVESVINNGIGCGNLTSYEVTVCNTGDADALITAAPPVARFADPAFSLVASVDNFSANGGGTVRAEQNISDTAGNFGGTLDNTDRFGTSVVSLGDLDGDGVIDLAVGADRDDDGDSARGAVWILFLDGLVNLAAGECATNLLSYDLSGVGAGTYDFSASITAIKDLPGDDDPLILPDINFTANATPGLDGFDGAVHSEDDVTVAGGTAACAAGDQISIAVDIPDLTACEAGFTTATVTFTNTSGVPINSALLELDLSGSGFTYAGEPYNLTGGLVLPAVNIFDPAYPAVANALAGSSGADTLDIYTLPNGTSSFDIDIVVGTGVGNLSAQATQIPAAWNDTGETNLATDATGLTAEAAPVITENTCPVSVVAGTVSFGLNYTVTGASTIQWDSTTGGTFSAPGAGISTYTIAAEDVANGFADLTLTANSLNACDATALCRVDITGVVYDYGDGPASYDYSLGKPIGAGHSLSLAGSTDVYLGDPTTGKPGDIDGAPPMVGGGGR